MLNYVKFSNKKKFQDSLREAQGITFCSQNMGMQRAYFYAD